MEKPIKNKKETKISRSIKILSEIEKMWILYDVDESGMLEYGEVVMYIKEMAPNLVLSDEKLELLFNQIDQNYNGVIDKKEMEIFLEGVMDNQMNL